MYDNLDLSLPVLCMIIVISLTPSTMYDNCDLSPSQYYAATASGYKDVVLVIDLETNSTYFPFSVYERAATYIFSTLSTLDYFGLVAGQDVLDSELIPGNSTGLNRAAQFVSTLKYQATPQHQQVCVCVCVYIL